MDHDICFSRGDAIAVRFVKKRGGEKTGALVAIDERMIADDAERVRRRQRDRIALAIGKEVLRPRHSGFQQAHVAKAAAAAVRRERFGVEQKDSGAFDPNGPFYFASSRSALR